MKKLSYTIYWLLQCTWGIIMTLIGGVAALVVMALGYKPRTLGPNVYFVIGHNWGGVNFGPFFFCCEEADAHTLYHEAGHGLQNIMWGPLFPFIIAIPSVVRYWVRLMPTRLKKGLFNAFFLLISFVVLTGLILLTGPWLHLHWLTIGLEFLRGYFLLVSLWLTLFEIPKYDCCVVPEYDSIWFEGQATKLGTKVYEKKED
jgi:hypothetical protein